MWKYNFRNGPNCPWREENTRVEIEPVRSHTEHSSVQIASTSLQLESIQESMYDHLDVRESSTSYLQTTHKESAVLCFELEDLDIMTSLNMTHSMERAPFTGSTMSGPTLAHLEQDFQALKSKIKLKNATNLNANDMCNFIGKMLAGGAKDQFLAVRRQFDEEVLVENAAASALYDRNKAAYDQAKIRWDALYAAARVGQVEPQAPAAHVDSEEFDRPVERFWVTIKELYPIKSPSRVKEFGTFAMLPFETIANLVQRMQTLKFALAVQKQTAVFKSIQAIRPASLGEEVRRQLYATGAKSEDWTVALKGQVAVRLDRAHSQEALWSVSVQHMDAPRAMARMAPRQPPPAPGAQRTETRSCQNCGKPGHIARFCRSQSAPAKPPVVRGHAAKAKSSAQTGRGCYHCNQPGHFASQCLVKRADLQNASGGKMWCTHHRVDSHNTTDCKALQSRAQPAKRVAAARSAQIAAPTRQEHKPTMAELQELWDAHYESMQGLCAKVMPTSVSRFSGHYNTLLGGHAAPLHFGLSAPAKKNERLRGPQTDMFLGFLPKDSLAVPVRPPPGNLGAPSNSTKEPVAEATPVPTVPTPPSVVEVTPLPKVPATLPPVDTRELPGLRSYL
jgi:hypothetical protein